MKNRFCSLFLLLLFIESGIVVVRNILSLAGIDLSKVTTLNIAEGIFSTVFMFLAITQVIIAFKNKLKWAAKLIGLYPLFFTLIAMIVGIGSLITGKPKIDSTNVASFAVGLSIYLLIIGFGQLSVGIWAAKRLASGHYETTGSHSKN
jgi:hypothetical protein